MQREKLKKLAFIIESLSEADKRELARLLEAEEGTSPTEVIDSTQQENQVQQEQQPDIKIEQGTYVVLLKTDKGTDVLASAKISSLDDLLNFLKLNKEDCKIKQDANGVIYIQYKDVQYFVQKAKYVKEAAMYAKKRNITEKKYVVDEFIGKVATLIEKGIVPETVANLKLKDTVSGNTVAHVLASRHRYNNWYTDIKDILEFVNKNNVSVKQILGANKETIQVLKEYVDLQDVTMPEETSYTQEFQDYIVEHKDELDIPDELYNWIQEGKIVIDIVRDILIVWVDEDIKEDIIEKYDIGKTFEENVINRILENYVEAYYDDVIGEIFKTYMHYSIPVEGEAFEEEFEREEDSIENKEDLEYVDVIVYEVGEQIPEEELIKMNDITETFIEEVPILAEEGILIKEKDFDLYLFITLSQYDAGLIDDAFKDIETYVLTHNIERVYVVDIDTNVILEKIIAEEDMIEPEEDYDIRQEEYEYEENLY